MIKKTVTYIDYNGNERTEDFYFNLSQAELMEMELGVAGGLSEILRKIVASNDTPSLIKYFKMLLFKAYGEKSPDGRQFVKSKELSTAFSQTEAYSKLFMEFATNDVAASDFVNGIMPEEAKNAAVNPVEQSG